jgi:hypothetical protein
MKNNDRLKEIDEYVDKVKPNDYINTIIENNSELKEYKFIDSVEMFSILKLKGSMKYVNKYDKKLRSGGLLIKIYKKENNQQWYAVIKKGDKKYYISYNSNYIFYIESRQDLFVDWASCFISDYNKGLYET